MDRKKLILLVGALVIAMGTFFAAFSMFSGASAPQAEAAPPVPEGPKVLIAQRGLPVGTIITADAIGFQQWPEELVQNAYFLDGESDIDQLLGTVVRHPITAGEPVTQGTLVKPGDRGFLAAALGAGMRAVTVPVSVTSGVGGFVFPGDRVDMVLTQTVKGGKNPLKVSETVLSNLRVLATDQRSTSKKSKDGNTVVRKFRTVTLEVTPRIAEKVAVAQKIGSLSLSLRSIADNQSELERAVASGEIKIPDDATPEQEEEILREAVLRPIDKSTSFVTGGDVSRFQRKTLQKQPDTSPAPSNYPSKPSSAPAAAPAKPKGPVVRVSRGNNTSEVPVKGGNSTSRRNQQNVEETRSVLPAAQKSITR